MIWFLFWGFGPFFAFNQKDGEKDRDLGSDGINLPKKIPFVYQISPQERIRKLLRLLEDSFAKYSMTINRWWFFKHRCLNLLMDTDSSDSFFWRRLHAAFVAFPSLPWTSYLSRCEWLGLGTWTELGGTKNPRGSGFVVSNHYSFWGPLQFVMI